MRQHDRSRAVADFTDFVLVGQKPLWAAIRRRGNAIASASRAHASRGRKPNRVECGSIDAK